MKKLLNLTRRRNRVFKPDLNIAYYIRVLLLMLTFFSLKANEGYTHQNKITINLQNVSVKQLIDEIEKTTDYQFFFRIEDVDLERTVSIQMNNVNISDILNSIFDSTTTTFNKNDLRIYLLKKPNALTNFEKAQKVTLTSQLSIEGTVQDIDGNPLAGATIIEKGTDNGVIADFDGKFTINVTDENVVLIVSYLGFASQNISLNGRSNITINLKEDAAGLDEVVVVGFGSQTEKELISSVTSIKTKDLKIPSSNLTTALAGRAAGLIAFQRGGEPGRDNANFFVRGITTFAQGASANPLILIDGVQLGIDDLRRLHPDDIDSFSILKDATATSIYGARGANGIVLVKTKKGVKGKVRISIRSEIRSSSPTKNIELADPITYMKLANRSILTRDPLGFSPYNLERINNTISGDDPILYPTVDWYNALFKENSLNKSLNFNLNGGGEVAQYYLSAVVNNDNGILNVPDINDFNSNVKFKNYYLRSNISVNLTNSTKLRLNFNLAVDSYRGPLEGGSGVYNNVVRSNPVLFRPFYEKTESTQFIDHVLFGNYRDPINSQLMNNPFAELAKGFKEDATTKLISQLEIDQKLNFLTEGLEAKVIINDTRESFYSLRRTTIPFYYSAFKNPLNNQIELRGLNPESGRAYLEYEPGDRNIVNSTYLETRLNYIKDVDDDNRVTGLLVGTLNNRQFSSANTLQESLAFRNVGLSGRFSYGFKSKYFAEFDFGYNGSERFAAKNRFGFFPSGGLGWSISDETFFKKFSKTITKFKIRATYGLVGNDQIGSANDRFFYLSEVNLNDGAYAFRTGDIGQVRNNGVSFSRYANDNITWEIAKKFNLGMELDLWNDFKFVGNYFSEKRENILVNRIVPDNLGLAAPVRANFGEAKSGGIDGTLTYTKSFDNDLWLQVNGNLTYATSEITKMEEPNYEAAETPWSSRIGHPIGQTWGLIAERLFVDDEEVENSPLQTFGQYSGGDIKYRDINGDGRITNADQVPIGNPTVPEIVYGIGFSLNYKNFDLSTFFQGAGNSSFWINPRNVAPFANGQTLLKAWADSHWSETNRDVYAKWPRLSNFVVDNNTQTSTWFMRNGSFLRLKSLEIGYSLPIELIDKINLKKVRLYASGTNLYVWSKFKLWDPELAGNGLNYPNQRVISAGINISL
ncbi:SusC/RagA family TonB-linked outer membrane protein [Maribacter ulvicola]|nr:TonB-dependent receptor [Maribacter ulvicola]